MATQLSFLPADERPAKPSSLTYKDLVKQTMLAHPVSRESYNALVLYYWLDHDDFAEFLQDAFSAFYAVYCEPLPKDHPDQAGIEYPEFETLWSAFWPPLLKRLEIYFIEILTNSETIRRRGQELHSLQGRAESKIVLPTEETQKRRREQAHRGPPKRGGNE